MAIVYKYFIYRKKDIIEVHRGKKKVVGQATERINKTSFTSLSALNSNFNKRIEGGETGIYKVIIAAGFGIGYKLYDKDLNYFGEIVSQTDNFWYVQRPLKTEKNTELPKITIIKKYKILGKTKNKATADIVTEDIEMSDEEKKKWLDALNKPVPLVKSEMKNKFINGCTGEMGFRIREEDIGK